MPFHGGDDRGESLIELLLTIVIIGIALVAVVGGLLTSIRLSDVHRKQASSGAGARSYAELVDRYVAAGHYVECASPSAYAPAAVGFTPPSGYHASVTEVEYWDQDSRAFSPTCTSTGLERVTVQVQSADARATERSVVVVRSPCGQGSTC